MRYVISMAFQLHSKCVNVHYIYFIDQHNEMTLEQKNNARRVRFSPLESRDICLRLQSCAQHDASGLVSNENIAFSINHNIINMFDILFQVHTLTTSCSRGITCTCGIAIRSHDSLFVVRTCDVISTELYASGRHYPSMTYSMCDNKHMVIEKITETQYKVSNTTHSDCLSCTGSIQSNCINWKMFHIIRSLFKIQFFWYLIHVELR